MYKTIYSKPTLSYSAQLAALKSSGMAFDDENKALHLLERIPTQHRKPKTYFQTKTRKPVCQIHKRGQSRNGVSRNMAQRTAVELAYKPTFQRTTSIDN